MVYNIWISGLYFLIYEKRPFALGGKGLKKCAVGTTNSLHYQSIQIILVFGMIICSLIIHVQKIWLFCLAMTNVALCLVHFILHNLQSTY